MLHSLTASILAACVEKGSDLCAQPSSVSQDHFSIIIGAIVAGFTAVMGFLGIVVQRQNRTIQRTGEAVRHAAAASDGINNHHPTNFRVDLDQKFERVFTQLGSIDGKVSVLSGRMDVLEETQEGGHNGTSQNPR